jgi:hypothetical protein
LAGITLLSVQRVEAVCREGWNDEEDDAPFRDLSTCVDQENDDRCIEGDGSEQNRPYELKSRANGSDSPKRASDSAERDIDKRFRHSGGDNGGEEIRERRIVYGNCGSRQSR